MVLFIAMKFRLCRSGLIMHNNITPVMEDSNWSLPKSLKLSPDRRWIWINVLNVISNLKSAKGAKIML